MPEKYDPLKSAELTTEQNYCFHYTYPRQYAPEENGN